MNCDNPGVRVVLENDGIEIPTVNWGVETTITTEGNGLMTTLSEVHYPYEWQGTDYSEAVQALNPEKQNQYDLVTIYYQEKFSGKMIPCQHGFIRGAGGTEQNGVGKF